MWPDNTKLNVRRAKLFMLFVLFMAMVQMMWSHPAHGQTTGTAEKFLPGSERFARGVTISFREEATVIGADVRLRQIARWSDADKAILDPIGELIVTRIDGNSCRRSLGVNEVKALLRDAGINLATIQFCGTLSCTVTRSDGVLDKDAALEKWAKDNPPADAVATARPSPALTSAAPALPPATQPATESVSRVVPPTAPPADPIIAPNPYHNLEQRLTENLAAKLQIPVETLQITFRGQDDRVLRLTEPHCQFTIEPQRTGALGDVSWNVTITSGGTSNRVFVQASARAWQEQVIIARPLATKQLITESDVETRRTLSTRLPDDILLRKEQVIGQIASREMHVGAVVTARCVEAPMMVRSGQFVTVELTSGGIVVKTVVRALEGGTYGQSIHVKNETTKDIFKVTITGPQQATLGEPVATASSE